MTNLRCWTIEQAEGAAGAILTERVVLRGATDLPEVVPFRDRTGTYWCLDTTTRGWQVWRGTWQPDRPSTRLESTLGVEQPLPGFALALEPMPALPPDASDPVAAIASAADSLRQAYEAGRATSEATDGRLRALIVVDTAGGTWTVGARSRAWYRFDGNRWSEAAPPDRRWLVPGDAIAGRCDGCGSTGEYGAFCSSCGLARAALSPEALAGLVAWAAAGSPLPETIADPWLPPAPPIREPLAPAVVAPTIPAPAAGPALPPERRRRRTPFRLASTALALLSGAALLADAVSGGGQLLAAFRTPAGPGATPSVAALADPTASSTTPIALSTPTARPTAHPTATPTAHATPRPTPSPAPTRASWYVADTSDSTPWSPDPTGGIALATNSGRLVFSAAHSQGPLYAWAAAGTPPSRGVAIEATLTLLSGGGTSEYGIAAAHLDTGMKLALDVHADGTWAIYLDDAEGLLVVDHGTVAAGPTHRLRLAITATTATAWVDGTKVATLQSGFEVQAIGISMRPQPNSASVALGRYEASTP